MPSSQQHGREWHRCTGCGVDRSRSDSGRSRRLQAVAEESDSPNTTRRRTTQQHEQQRQLQQQREPPTQQQQQQQKQQRRQPQPPQGVSPSSGGRSVGAAVAPRTQSAAPISIESIASTLESGQSQTSSARSNGNNPSDQQQQQVWRDSSFDQRGRGDAAAAGLRSRNTEEPGWVGDDQEPGYDDGRNGFPGGRAGVANAARDPGVVEGGDIVGEEQSKGNPNKLSLRKRRARERKRETPEEKQLQNEVALALKADSAEETLRSFNTAMEMGVALRANLLRGVLNQCAKAGLMDDCMRVVMEMKERGMVIEENTYVPLIRGMVSHGNCHDAFDLIKDMVNQGVQPRLRCYEPVIAEMCREGGMDAAREVWEHMEQQGVIPREEQYVNYLCGLSVAGELWDNARSGKLDEKLLEMSYHARNLTMGQVEQLEEHFNAVPLAATPSIPINGDAGAVGDTNAFAITEAVKSSVPLARRVKVAGGHEIDDDSWTREWSSRKPTRAERPHSCPACGGALRAVGLTDGERARIRETLFGLAGLQVKKHARSRHTKMLARSRQRQGNENPFYSFTDEDQKEQLQIFVDWLHAQRADGKTYTAVIDSANVAYHKGSAFHFSLPQVDLMVQALEAKGERPLVLIAEKYIDRVGDLYDNSPARGGFRYMSNPLNKAIVKRWRAKSQLYECSDEASDDWYWMYATVAFDDIPMTVISNDRTRDHRMSLAETVPYLRWRTTQLAQFELTYPLKDIMGKGLNPQGWPANPPQVAIQPPPAFTRDVQKSEQGCWHVPAGADDEWLCIDVQRGLRMGLDKLMPTPRKTHPNIHADSPPGETNDGSARDVAMVSSGGGARTGGAEDDTLRKVGGLLQSMRVRKQHSRSSHSTQGTVEEAAVAAKRAAARARADATAADALVAEALFADAQTTGGVSRDSPYARVLAADAARVKDRGEDVGSAAAAAAIPPAPVPAAPKATPRDPDSISTTTGGAASQPPGIRHTGERGARAVLPPETSRSTAADAIEDSLKEDGAEERVSDVDETASENEQHRQRWSSMKVVSLKEELRSRGLKVSGKKAELVERLLRA
ncbi:multidrug resistance pump, putative [Ectocarpus siliculosus]|uniref:ribonuclease P n=1 Tax=Ectocarpus siliculosus TaxID=2880 RepID=D8LN58_ECTSI|nr:multidrug resistance pump, putative [Ectocarpus siliculosus]|eukprot:CBN74821.1 multidrug resistance pump, putative [Ectocarpus siliculosus]